MGGGGQGCSGCGEIGIHRPKSRKKQEKWSSRRSGQVGPKSRGCNERGNVGWARTKDHVPCTLLLGCVLGETESVWNRV